MESSLIFLKIGYIKQENGVSTQTVRAIKKNSESPHQTKFEDGSVKQNFLIACTGLALAPFSCNGEWQGFFSYLKRNLIRTHTLND